MSRVDTETDRRLPDDSPLRGKAAVANAKLAYELFRQRFSGARWDALAAQGAKLQRPLWASTSTKNPAYSPTLYVDDADRPRHGEHARAGVDRRAAAGRRATCGPTPSTEDVDGAHQVMTDLAAAGVDFDDVTATLEREGVDSFAHSFKDAFATLEKRTAEVGQLPTHVVHSGSERHESTRHECANDVGVDGVGETRGGAEVVGELGGVACALSPLVFGIT